MYYTDREKADDYVFGQLASYRFTARSVHRKFLQEQWRVCFMVSGMLPFIFIILTVDERRQYLRSNG